MKNALIKFLLILVVLFVAGGFAAVIVGLEAMWQILVCIFPFLAENFAQNIKDYLTSAYFIVGVIIYIGSSFGFAFSVKQRKLLYAFISGLLNIISLISLISNFVSCA